MYDKDELIKYVAELVDYAVAKKAEDNIDYTTAREVINGLLEDLNNEVPTVDLEHEGSYIGLYTEEWIRDWLTVWLEEYTP